MNQGEKICCKKNNQKRGALSGIALGIIPHSFCIFFIIFSIVGAVKAASILKGFLLVPNLFLFLTIISLVLATVSSALYLKKNNCLCFSGIRSRYKYLAVLYSTTLLVNLLMFFVIFPALANVDFQKAPKETEGVFEEKNNFLKSSISVEIPCSGHAPLIIDEITKNYEVDSVTFSMPDKFIVKYDPKKTTPEEIVSLDIFKTYPARIN